MIYIVIAITLLALELAARVAARRRHPTARVAAPVRPSEPVGYIEAGPNIAPIDRIWIDGGQFHVDAYFHDVTYTADQRYKVLGPDGAAIWESSSLITLGDYPADWTYHFEAVLRITHVDPRP